MPNRNKAHTRRIGGISAYQTTCSALTLAGAKENSDYILKVAKPVCDEKAMIL